MNASNRYHSSYSANVAASDNLDLIQITRKLIQYVQGRMRRILLIFSLCLVVSAAAYLLRAPVYESRLTAETENLQAARVVDLIQDLDKLLEQENYDRLAQYLDLKPKQLRRVEEIKVQKILGVKGREEQSKMFSLQAKVTDLGLLDTLDYGIGHYLSNNYYAKIRMELKRRDLKARISRIETEMAELDSAKGLSLEDLDIAPDNRLSFNLKAPANLSLELVQLYREKLRLQQELELAKEVSIIQNFVKFDEPVSPKVGVHVALAVVAALFIIGMMAFAEAVSSSGRTEQSMQPSEVRQTTDMLHQ